MNARNELKGGLAMPTEPKCGPLTAAAISKQAEMPLGTPADMAIALRNHASRMEADRARLIEALLKHVDANDHGSVGEMRRSTEEIRSLLRDLGALK